MSITVLLPENLYSAPLRALLEPLLPPGSVIRRPEDGMEDLQNRRLLFAVALDPGGCNLAYYGMLRALRGSDTLLRGSVAGVIVTGVGEFYTKDVARDMVFAANQAGCAFLGRPLVEATGSLRNFRIQAQIGGVDEKTAFRLAVRELIARLDGWRPLPPVRRVLALHASQCSTSNTLALWELVKAALPPEIAVEEVGLRNGTVPDLQRVQLYRLSPLRGAGQLLLRRPHGGGGVSGRPPVRRPGDAVRQLQRRPVRQSHRLRQPADGPVPPDPVL